VALLILIAGLWIVVLTPGIVKRIQRGQSTGSIEHFHQQLHLLERTGPKLVSPAYRLASTESNTGVAPGASGYPAVSSMPGRPSLVLVADGAGGDGEATTAGGRGRPALRAAPVVDDSARHAEYARLRRQHAVKRRRDLLGILVVLFVLTGIVGIVPPLHLVWVVTALVGLCLGAYVVLVAYARNLVLLQRRTVPLRRYAVDADPSAVSQAATAGLPGAWDDMPDDEVDAGSLYVQNPRAVAH
jgi:hypothetical protein